MKKSKKKDIPIVQKLKKIKKLKLILLSIISPKYNK